MSERNLTNVFIWPYSPRDWRCHEIGTGITAIGATREEALAGFKNAWGERAPFQLIEHAPPRPKRPDDPKPAGAAIEGETAAAAFHRGLLMAFHSDRHGPRSYTGDEVVAVINRLWNETSPKT